MRGLVAALDLSTRLFGARGKVNWRLLAAILSIAVFQAAIVAIVTKLEGSWWLPRGRGFSQHYGAWMILATDPLLLMASGLIDSQFRTAMLSLPTCPTLNHKHRLRQLCVKYSRLIQGRGGSAFLYALLLMIGVYSWSLNVVETYDPTGPYHHPIFNDHDVFDSGLHMFSYVAFKICLFTSWCIVYPIVGFKFIVVSYSTWRILRIADGEGLIMPRAEHPDGSYGMKEIGTLNITLLVPYFLVFSIMASLFETHKELYGSLVVPWIAVIILFLLSSFIVIWPASRILAGAKRKLYRSLRQVCLRDRIGGKSEMMFLTQRFYYSAATASPYSDGTKAILVAMRLTPVLGLALKFVHGFRG
jgi:hypothetical protein